MNKNSISDVRVRYNETDKMGVVHHGNYANYFELARIEWLENYGISYKSMEEEGIQLPVYELNIEYRSPAFFDDLLTIETRLREKPTAKITFDYVVRNQMREVLAKATSILVFTKTSSMRPIRCPEYVLKALGW